MRLLTLLRDGETCVGDLVSVLQLPQPTVSRHLSTLRRAGLVEVARDGNWIFYRLARPSNGFHRQLLACLSCFAAADPTSRKDVRRLERLRVAGGCCVRSAQACGAKRSGRASACVE
ncbi:MAG: helix-turn-helix transcriptional regulator [Phycisphaerales bacterium]|nr:helix-turn-helix transcriptional regulator [Phycisphaerales bacterium]